MHDVESYLVLKSVSNKYYDLSDKNTPTNFKNIYKGNHNLAKCFFNQGNGYIEFNASGLNTNQFAFIFKGDLGMSDAPEILNLGNYIEIKYWNETLYVNTKYKNYTGQTKQQGFEVEFTPKANDWIGFVVDGTKQFLYTNKDLVFSAEEMNTLNIPTGLIQVGRIANRFVGYFEEASVYNGEVSPIVLLALMNETPHVRQILKVDKLLKEPSFNHQVYQQDLFQAFNFSSILPTRFDERNNGEVYGARGQEVRVGDTKIRPYQLLNEPPDTQLDNELREWETTDYIDDMYDLSVGYDIENESLVLTPQEKDNVCLISHYDIQFRRDDFIGIVGYYDTQKNYCEETLNPVWDKQDKVFKHSFDRYVDTEETIQISAIDFNNELIGFIKRTQPANEILIDNTYHKIWAKNDLYFYSKIPASPDDLISENFFYDYIGDYYPTTANVRVVDEYTKADGQNGVILNIDLLDTKLDSMIYEVNVYINNNKFYDGIEVSKNNYITCDYNFLPRVLSINTLADVPANVKNYLLGYQDGYFQYFFKDNHYKQELAAFFSGFDLVISYFDPLTISIKALVKGREIKVGELKYTPKIENLYQKLRFEPIHDYETFTFKSI